MTRHLDSQGNEIEPRPDFPAQDLWDRMGLAASAPVTVGPLSEAHKAILAEPVGLDRREFDYLIASGQGFGAAYKAASTPPVHASSSLTKMEKVQLLQKGERLLVPFSNTAMLQRFHDKTLGKTMEEQLADLTEKACHLLGHERAALLRKAVKAMDVQLIHFFLEEAFIGQAA
jgi:hypothetical protein